MEGESLRANALCTLKKKMFTCFKGRTFCALPADASTLAWGCLYIILTGQHWDEWDRRNSISTVTAFPDYELEMRLLQRDLIKSSQKSHLTPPPPSSSLLKPDRPPAEEPGVSFSSVCPNRVQVFTQAASVAVDTFSLTDKHPTISRTVR